MKKILGIVAGVVGIISVIQCVVKPLALAMGI